MNNKIRKTNFDDYEVDCLIRSFGMSKSSDKRLDIQEMLRRQKEPFMARELSRSHKRDNSASL